MTAPAHRTPHTRSSFRWATAPLVLLDLPTRIAFAERISKISRPPDQSHFTHRAVKDFWSSISSHSQAAMRIEREGETSDLLDALAHHKRRAFSALTAVPGLTLSDLYPITVSASGTA